MPGDAIWEVDEIMPKIPPCDELATKLEGHRKRGEESIQSGVMPYACDGVSKFIWTCWKNRDTILTALRTPPPDSGRDGSIASTRTPMDGEVGELIERLRAEAKDCREAAPLLMNADGARAVIAKADKLDCQADTLTAYRDKVERLEAMRGAATGLADVVERLCDAIERQEQDIGGESVKTVLLDLGPAYDRARSALTDPPNLPPGD